VHGARLAGIKF